QDRVVELPSGGRVVVLDSSVPGAGYGHLEDAQLDWLRGVLAEPAPGGAEDGGAGRGTVLAIHHPPLVAATPMLRALDLDGLDALAEVLEGSDVRIVLSGHYHHSFDGSIGAVPVHVVPGITNVVDPLAAGREERSLALSGASLIEINPESPLPAMRAADSSRDVQSAFSFGGRRDESAGDADGFVAPRVVTSVWPNGGDTAGPDGGPDVTRPVYAFSSEQVQQIIDTAGR
ncbi:MAG: hypothetical protein Q4G40_12770, partial [Brachybacterium sp.]|nr:hypothetical protein [Brachybacterium sp.]